MSTTVDTTCLP